MLSLLENYSVSDLYTVSLGLFIIGIIAGFIFVKFTNR